MWLWYDWRAAAVADSDGNILDIEIWDGWKDLDALCSRIDIISNDATTPDVMRSLFVFDPLAPPLLFCTVPYIGTSTFLQTCCGCLFDIVCTIGSILISLPVVVKLLACAILANNPIKLVKTNT